MGWEATAVQVSAGDSSCSSAEGSKGSKSSSQGSKQWQMGRSKVS